MTSAVATAAGPGLQEPQCPGAGGQVVVGVDDTPGGLAALRWAIGCARSSGARLVAVRTWALGLPRHGGLRHDRGGRGPVVLTFNGMEPRHEADRLTRRAFRAAAGEVPGDLEVIIETPEGNPGPVLTQLAGAGDVLVVGSTPGHSLKRALHGSVSAYCAEHAHCPVTVVTAGAPGESSSTATPDQRPARGSGRGARR